MLPGAGRRSAGAPAPGAGLVGPVPGVVVPLGSGLAVGLVSGPVVGLASGLVVGLVAGLGVAAGVGPVVGVGAGPDAGSGAPPVDPAATGCGGGDSRFGAVGRSGRGPRTVADTVGDGAGGAAVTGDGGDEARRGGAVGSAATRAAGTYLPPWMPGTPGSSNPPGSTVPPARPTPSTITYPRHSVDVMLTPHVTQARRRPVASTNTGERTSRSTRSLTGGTA